MYPDRDYLETCTNNIVDEKAIDIHISEDDTQSTIALNYKGMKKLRKHLKEQMKLLEDYYGKDTLL